MADGSRYRFRPAMLPGAVTSAVSYQESGMEPGAHRGLPSPWLTFIVSVEAPLRVSGLVDEQDTYDATRATAYDVIVAGLHPVATMVEQPSAQQGIQLALHPLAAPALLGCRAADLLAQGDHGRDVLGATAVELHERVGSCADPDDRLDVVQQWVRRRLEQSRPGVVRPEVRRAWQLVEASGGRCRIDDVARAVSLSPRQLRELMTRELGISPKALARSFRFHHVVRALASGTPSLAEVATATGYADQSHLTREFKVMTGTTPSAWLVEERRNIQGGGYEPPAE